MTKSATYKVVWPIGNFSIKGQQIASNVPDLNGKTICGSGHSYHGDELIDAIVKLLQKQYPHLKFVPNAEMPDEVSTKEEIGKFQTVLREKKCDVVLSGTGC